MERDGDQTIGTETQEQFLDALMNCGFKGKDAEIFKELRQLAKGKLSKPVMDVKELSKFIVKYDKDGLYTKIQRSSYPPVGKSFHVPVEAATCSLRNKVPMPEGVGATVDVDIKVYVTVPELGPDGTTTEALPVVFIFNAFALGLQRCEWYFDYASRIASWGYVVVQYESVNPLRNVNSAEVEQIVNFLLQWACGGLSQDLRGSVPLPSFRAAALDPESLAFMGHSKGGSDAAYMLAKQPTSVQSTCLTVDGVDPLFAASLLLLSQPTTDRSMCLIRADTRSFFNLQLFVDNLMCAASKYSGRGTVAALSLQSGHFTFVAPKWIWFVRAPLVGVVQAVGKVLPEGLKKILPPGGGFKVDTCRQFQSKEGQAQPGVFDQIAATAVAWLEGEYRPGSGATVQKKFAKKHAHWNQNEL
jgi:hypothetical protein